MSDRPSAPTASSSSGSRSPASPPASDIPSTHPSPAAASSERAARHAEHARQLAAAAGSRGGCWTCRVRRKKCDEERVGDSCKTCIRLKIECLGWGPRPLWLRDKQALEAYKASIKAKLKEAGLIRGIPRSPPAPPSSSLALSPASASASSSAPPSSLSTPASQLPMPLPGAPGPAPSYLPDDNPYFPDQQFSAPSMPSPGAPTALAYATNAAVVDYSSESYTPSPSTTSPYIEQGPAGRGLAAYVAPSTPSASSPAQPPTHSLEQQHVFYYFQSVLPIQYIFAADSLTNVLHDSIIQNPLGVVTTASCALASLHNKAYRVARGLELPDHHPEQSPAHTFYARTMWQLNVQKVLNSCYSESDALAALQLIWYWLFQGGSGEWPIALDIACEWLDQSTGISRGENPKMLILKLSEAGKFAVKTTMWMDIFSSITFQQAPRFLSLYRRLLGGGGAGFWARNDLDLRMNELMGCPDDVLLCFAEVSALSQWKNQERNQGTLSMRELIKRGDAIEEMLRKRRDTPPPNGQEYEQTQHLQVPGSSGTAPMRLQRPTITVTTAPESNGISDLHSQIGRIFRATALLYLHTVLSESNPGVPEIASAVTSVLTGLSNLAPSIADRALVFPMFLAGCMTDVPNQRDVVIHRMKAQDEICSNIGPARRLMEHVWRVRDNQRTAVDWRNVMIDTGMTPFLFI